MKVAISVSMRDGDTVFERRFGRAPAFVIVETDTHQSEVITNPAGRLDSGAGIRTAELIIRQGGEAVISGAFGPKACDVLQAAGMRMYQAQSGTVNELIERLLRGDLAPVEGA